MKSSICVLAIMVASIQLGSPEVSNPKLLEARKFWENPSASVTRSEREVAAQYRKLKEIYSVLQIEDLGSVDRLGKQAVLLRCAYLDMPQISIPAYEEGIRRSLAEFHNVIRGSRNVAERTEGYTVVAEQYGINVAFPKPPRSLIEDVVQSGILTSSRLPNMGRTYGSALSGILTDAIPLYSPEERAFLKTTLANLVELDGGNIAGTSVLHSELQKLNTILASPLVSDDDNIDHLRQELRDSAERWKQGLTRMDTRCNGLFLAEQYTDQLYRAFEKVSHEKIRKELLLRSLYSLKDTLVDSYSSCSSPAGLVQLGRAQNQLLDRLLDWSWEQWIQATSAPTSEERITLVEGLTRLLTQFVDDSSEFLRKEQQAFIHSYLAQAFTLLSEDKKAMAHYQKAKEILPIGQLEQLVRQRAALGKPNS